MNNIKISPRMRCLESMIIEGKSLADIGTDHGFVPLDLLASGKIPYAILTDINQGPLDIAKKHACESGFSAYIYDLRLGGGLDPIKCGEVSTVIIAGMGGEMIETIIDKDIEKSKSFERFVLQPRTHANELRHYLSINGFCISDYRLVKEKGRICEVFSAGPSISDVKEDTSLISDFLIKKNDPLIFEFVDNKINMAQNVLSNLANSDSAEADSLKELWNSVLYDLNEIRSRI